MERNAAHRTSIAFEDVYRGNRGNTDFYGTLGVLPKAIERHAFNGSVHLRGKFRIGSHESEPADFLENLSRGRLRARYLHVLQWTVGRASARAVGRGHCARLLWSRVCTAAPVDSTKGRCVVREKENIKR